MKSRKIAAALIIAALTAGSAWAIDLSTFPSPIEKGSLLISPNFGLGEFWAGWAGVGNETLLGGGVAVDYALPINIAFTVGGEAGFYGAKMGKDSKTSLGMIPILGRFAWHPNWEVKGLDTYVMAKIGVGIGFWLGDKVEGLKSPFGLAYGFDVGVRYFFTDTIGVFLEGGYEYYFLEYKVEVSGYSATFSAFGDKFVALGMTFKL